MCNFIATLYSPVNNGCATNKKKNFPYQVAASAMFETEEDAKAYIATYVNSNPGAGYNYVRGIISKVYIEAKRPVPEVAWSEVKE